MLKAILTRFRQGHRTMAYPDAPLPLPPRFRGLPLLDASRCRRRVPRLCRRLSVWLPFLPPDPCRLIWERVFSAATAPTPAPMARSPFQRMPVWQAAAEKG